MLDICALSQLGLSSLVTDIVTDERGCSGGCLQHDGRLRCGGKSLFVVGVTVFSASPGRL